MNARFFDIDNYLITAPDITGPWSEPVYIHSAGFDASLFHDDDGRKWISSLEWETRDGYTKPGAICIVEYSPETGSVIGYPQRISSGSTLRGCLEGPHIYKHNGMYYLMCAEGGTVMASFRSFFADENLRIWNDAQPHGLTDVFGMHYSLFTRDSRCCWQELLETGAAEQISGYDNKYRSGYASVTRNVYGKGHAWYVGAVPSEDELKGYIRDACRDAEIELPGTSWPVTVRNAYTDDGRKVCFLFNYSSDSRTVASPVSGTDIFTAKTIAEGDRLILSDWDLRVIVSQ